MTEVQKFLTGGDRHVFYVKNYPILLSGRWDK